MNLRNYLKNNFPSLQLYGYVEKQTLTVRLSNYFTDDEEYISDCYHKALWLFEHFFHPQDDVILVVNVYQEKNTDVLMRPRLRNYMKSKSLMKKLNCIRTDGEEADSTIFDENEVIMHYYLCCKVKEINYKKLLLHLCQHEVCSDLRPRIKPMNDYFIIHKKEKVCFRMLDDRDADLIFNDLKLKDEWEKKSSRV